MGRAFRRFEPGDFAAWLVPAALIVYLAMANGGYGLVERGQVGVIAWWTVLVGTAVGALPIAGGSRSGRVMLALLTLFAGWTLLSFGWTESDERTSIELARVAAYLGIFALALSIQGGERWRYMFNGMATAAAIVCGIAVLSRLEPGWFPERITGEYLTGIEIERRLAYPLNYSSGLGAWAAISLPLLLAVATSARTLVGQALAASTLPLILLTLWLTTSSLSVPVAAVGIVAFIVLSPDRLPRLLTAAVAGGGAAILLLAAAQREALDRGLVTEAAEREGRELLVILLVICAGVGLLQVAIGLAARYAHRPSWMQITRRRATTATLASVAIVVVGAVGAGLPSTLSDEWDDFKAGGYGGEEVAPGADRGAQLLDFSSSGRYQFWESAAEAFETDPVKGIGPGTFEYWWSREGDYPIFVRDAHSLFVETLAELGIVGFLLIAAFGVGILGLGIARVRSADSGLRAHLAGATAACACFLLAAAVDWTWELGVLPVLFLGCAAFVVSAGRSADGGVRSRPAGTTRRFGRAAWATRLLALVALPVVGVVAIALPLAGAIELEKSRGLAGEGRVTSALSAASSAAAAQPYAASPPLQRALILESVGMFRAAAEAARTATDAEPTNWRTWFVRSRMQARVGNAKGSVRSFREARQLNPNSSVIAAAVSSTGKQK